MSEGTLSECMHACMHWWLAWLSRWQVVDEVFDLIYFFDEHVGHAIFFSSLHSFVWLWTYFHSQWVAHTLKSSGDSTSTSSSSTTRHRQKELPQRAHQQRGCFTWLVQQLLPVAAGGACGVVHAVAFIEGSSREMGMVLSSGHLAVVGLQLLTIGRRRRHGHRWQVMLSESELLRFTLTLGLTVMASTGLYNLAFPGGETPSQLGGWWCVALPQRFDYCVSSSHGSVGVGGGGGDGGVGVVAGATALNVEDL